MAAHQQAIIQIVTLWTVKRVFRQAGWRWRRVRKSLKEQQDPIMMAFFTQEFSLLKTAHRQAQFDLWFYDETGLGLNPTGVYAWQSKDQTAHLPAQRGQGFTVAGFLTLENRLHAYSYSGPTTSRAFIQFVEEWISQYPPQRKTVLVVDNASFHCSADVLAKRKQWAEQRVYLQYLPAYGSELNLIEVLWHRLKHEWLTLNDYESGQHLRTATESILRQVGEKYTITFA
jgi:transposase